MIAGGFENVKVEAACIFKRRRKCPCQGENGSKYSNRTPRPTWADNANGAKLVDLERWKLDKAILRKADGTISLETYTLGSHGPDVVKTTLKMHEPA